MTPFTCVECMQSIYELTIYSAKHNNIYQIACMSNSRSHILRYTCKNIVFRYIGFPNYDLGICIGSYICVGTVS